MSNKLNKIIEWYSKQLLFVKMLIGLFILFGITVAVGSPTWLVHILSACIIGVILFYLYKVAKAKYFDK